MLLLEEAADKNRGDANSLYKQQCPQQFHMLGLPGFRFCMPTLRGLFYLDFS